MQKSPQVSYIKVTFLKLMCIRIVQFVPKTFPEGNLISFRIVFYNNKTKIMKRVIMVAFAVGLLACNSNQKTTARNNTDLIQSNLKDKVKTLEERNVNFDSVGRVKPDSTFNTTNFNEEGYITEYTSKDSLGKTTLDQTVSHNADGTVSEWKNTKDGKQVFRLITEVDKNGNYIGGKTFDSTGKQDSYYTDLKTNEYGIVYAGKQHFMNGKLKSTFEMKYEGSNFVGGTSTDSAGKTSYEGTLKLNDKGDAIEEHSTTREKDSTRVQNLTYKYDSYDDKGNWTQRTAYNEKGKPTAIVRRIITYYKN